MKEETFTELVNLYFDEEITSSELDLLQQELAVSPVRQSEFHERYRLHQAMRMAVAPEAREVARFRELIAKKAARASRLTLWVFGGGLAACATCGFVLFSPVVQESSSVVATEELAEASESNLEQYAARRSEALQMRGSLVSQLRLMGLTPQMAPELRQLDGVDIDALRQAEAHRLREIEHLNQYKAFLPMPEPQSFESYGQPAVETHGSRLPAGFRSSLASF